MDSDDARERLRAEQQRVEGLIEGFRNELGTSENDDTSELADYDQHPADTASETFEREKLQGMVADLRSESRQEDDGQVGELSSYDQHPADEGSETFEREKDLSILEQLENELAELQAALERVDAGTYGVDEVTGDPIDPERLDAFPTARTNIPDTGIPDAGDDR